MKARWAVFALVIATLGSWWWLQRSPPIAVRTAVVASGAVEASVANTRAGTVKACRRSRLSMPIGGVVDRLLVKEGDRVSGDQLLLELWNRDRLAERQQAEAALLTARSQRAQACRQAQHSAREALRQRRLQERGLAAAEVVERAKTEADTRQLACEAAAAQIAVADAQLALRRAIYERSQLRAPFAGVVAEVNGELGEYVTPSPPGVATPPAVDLIDDSCLYVSAPIDEVDARHLRIGLPVRITLDAYRDRSFEGRLSRIAPYVLDLEKQARTVEVDVAFAGLPQELPLLVGYSADVLIVLERRDAVLRLPSEALVGGSSVWLLDDELRVRQRSVEVGLANWSFTEIRSGLRAGDRVVLNPDVDGLAEGVVVRVRDD